MTITEAELSEMTFGIELEYDRISTHTAAKTVAEAVGGTYRYDGSHLSNWVVTMPRADLARGPRRKPSRNLLRVGFADPDDCRHPDA